MKREISEINNFTIILLEKNYCIFFSPKQSSNTYKK